MNYGDYAALFTDARGELCYLADIDTHEMIFMSRAAMELTGLTDANGYAGKKCYQVVQGLDAPCSFCNSDRLLRDEGPFVWEQFNPVAQKWLRLESRLFELDGRRCRGEWALDISSEHARITTLEDQLEREQVLARCVRTLANAPDAQSAVNRFLRYIGQYYQADRACIFEMDNNARSINNTFEWCAGGIERQMERFQNLPAELVRDWMDRFSGGVPRQFSFESQKDTGMEQVFAQRNVNQLLVAPLTLENALVGFLGVDNARAHGGEIQLLSLAAALVTEEFQKRQLIQDLNRRRTTDRLTGLGNRNRYLQALDQYRLQPPSSLTVFFLDMDGLWELNEQFGHDAGDQFICQCADALRQLELNAFRVDGDEFIVLEEDLTRPQADQLEQELRALLEQISAGSISMGSAWRCGDVDAPEMVSIAAERMYAQKQLYYRSIMAQPRRQYAGMATDVLKDILSKHFVPYYQPQVDLRSGKITDAEVLLRKLDSEGNFIPPNHFIPMYESAGVISHVDFHVLDMICQQIRIWEKMRLRPNISVNFSRKSLMEPDAPARMHDICRKYGVQPGQITIEVTENAARLTRAQLKAVAGELQERGFSVSLDDFGVHDSNLSILAGVSFQTIKLDKSLVDEMSLSQRAERIVYHLLDLCRNTLGTPVLAEGVENREQARLLRSLKCEYAQGYYFSRPLPCDAFTVLMQEGKTYEI